MKRLQEYTDEGGLIPFIGIGINQIERLPLPYTGNKKKLLTQFHNTLIQHNVEFSSVLDAFSGSGAISLLFKMMGKKVLSNDLLTSSYLNAVSFMENPGIRLTSEEQKFLIFNQNKNKNSFVEDNYLASAFRKNNNECRFNKFTLRECVHLDNFRANIDEIDGIYKQSLGLIANAAIIMRLPFGNVDQSIDIMAHRLRQHREYGVGTKKHDRRIGIYLDEEMNLNFKKWFPKYVKNFLLEQQEVFDKKAKRATFLENLLQHTLKCSKSQSSVCPYFTETPGSCLAVNLDTVDLLNIGFADVDCIYFDPPYGGGSSDYASIYRFLEEYIYSKPLEDLPHIQNGTKRFVGKKNYEEHFIEMLAAAKNIPTWIFSYNNDSWKDISYISELISKFKSNVSISVLTDSYRYLCRKNQSRDNTSTEYLIIAQ